MKQAKAKCHCEPEKLLRHPNKTFTQTGHQEKKELSLLGYNFEQKRCNRHNVSYQ